MSKKEKIITLSIVLGIGLYWLIAIVATHAGSELKSSLESYSAAIKDQGSSCHPQRVIEQKDRIEVYNLDSLKGNK